MSRPNYRVVLAFDSERKTFTARVPELPHCTAEGLTRAEAILHVEEELEALYANLLSQGRTPPLPLDELPDSGDITVKTSRGLHRDLRWQAAQEGVDLSQLAAELLAQGLEQRRQARPRRSYENQPSHSDQRGPRNDGGDRRRGGPPNHMLDDRAHFIEYVRNLENDGRRGPGQGPSRDGRRNDSRGDNRRDHGPRPPQNRDRRPPQSQDAKPNVDQGSATGNTERGS